MTARAGGQKGKSKKNKRITRLIVFSVEILIILAMLLVVWKVFQVTDSNPDNGGGSGGPHIADIPEDNIVINDAVKEDPVMKGYWNVALFGLDAQTC